MPARKNFGISFVWRPPFPPTIPRPGFSHIRVPSRASGRALAPVASDFEAPRQPEPLCAASHALRANSPLTNRVTFRQRCWRWDRSVMLISFSTVGCANILRGSVRALIPKTPRLLLLQPAHVDRNSPNAKGQHGLAHTRAPAETVVSHGGHHWSPIPVPRSTFMVTAELLRAGVTWRPEP